MPPSGRNLQPGIWQQVARGGFCALSADPERFARIAADTITVPSIQGTNSLRNFFDSNPQAALAATNVGRALFCDELPQPVPDGVGPPFSGGQCEDELYNVEISWRWEDNTNTQFSSVNQVRGPITPVSRPHPTVAGVTLEGFAFKNPTTFAPDEVVVESPRIRFGAPGPELLFIRLNNEGRADGGPDDCGNPPSQTGPPTPADRRIPVNFPTTDPDGNPVDEPGDLVVGPPYIGPNGGINFPFRVEFNDGVDITGNFDFGGNTVNFSIDGGSSDFECCTDGGLEEFDVPDETDADSIIVGCVVRAVVPDNLDSQKSIRPDGAIPELFIPDIGTVNFQIISDVGENVWSRDYRVKNASQYIEAPAPSARVRFFPRPGVTGTATPVRRTGPVEQQF